MDAEWKDVVGFEGLYKVSDKGEVKRLFKVVNNKIFDEKIMSKRLDPLKYFRVSLTKNKISYDIRIHRLVAEAFVSNPWKRNVVNHIDGNKLNNNKENLEWVTINENILHAHRTGLHANKTRKQI